MGPPSSPRLGPSGPPPTVQIEQPLGRPNHDPAPGEIDLLLPLLEPLLARDAAGTVAAMERAGFLPPDHGLDPDVVLAYVSRPYLPYLEDEYTFTPGFAAGAVRGLLDVTGPHRAVMDRLTMPPSFVVLHRVGRGMTALLRRLHAHHRWRAVLEEYRSGGPPSTELGEREARWRRGRPPPPCHPCGDHGA